MNSTQQGKSGQAARFWSPEEHLYAARCLLRLARALFIEARRAAPTYGIPIEEYARGAPRSKPPLGSRATSAAILRVFQHARCRRANADHRGGARSGLGPTLVFLGVGLLHPRAMMISMWCVPDKPPPAHSYQQYLPAHPEGGLAVSDRYANLDHRPHVFDAWKIWETNAELQQGFIGSCKKTATDHRNTHDGRQLKFDGQFSVRKAGDHLMRSLNRHAPGRHDHLELEASIIMDPRRQVRGCALQGASSTVTHAATIGWVREPLGRFESRPTPRAARIRSALASRRAWTRSCRP